MPTSMQAGDVLAERYRLDDLLAENGTGRFWRAHDLVLHRAVSVHLLAADDERAPAVLEAARGAGPVIDRRLLRVLDAESADGRCYVVNEWGQGDSLDILRRPRGSAAAASGGLAGRRGRRHMAEAHAAGLAHGRLVPENVLVDQHGQIRIIGFGVDAALRGLPAGRTGVDEIDLAGLLYCALTGKWAGASESAVPPAPEVHGEVLRPRRVRAGIPRMLDAPLRPGAQPPARARRRRVGLQRPRDPRPAPRLRRRPHRHARRRSRRPRPSPRRDGDRRRDRARSCRSRHDLPEPDLEPEPEPDRAEPEPTPSPRTDGASPQPDPRRPRADRPPGRPAHPGRDAGLPRRRRGRLAARPRREA